MLNKEKVLNFGARALWHFNVPCYHLLHLGVTGALNGTRSEGCQYKRKQYGFSSQRIMDVLTLPMAPWGMGISVCLCFAHLRASQDWGSSPGHCLSKLFRGKYIRCCCPGQKVTVGVRNIPKKNKEESWEENMWRIKALKNSHEF